MDIENSLQLLGLIRESGLKPSLETYSTLLTTFCRANKLNLALQMLEVEMPRDNLQPNASHFRLFTKTLIRNGNFSLAEEFLEKMGKYSDHPEFINLRMQLSNKKKNLQY